MIKPPRNPYGYRNLLVYKKADELQSSLADFISHFPPYKTRQTTYYVVCPLSDQMERSARSTKQNIVEGWKRNSTNEYYQFLGFAIASNAELEEDFMDICKGVYDSKGINGIKREKGEWIYKGEEREKREWEKGEKREGEKGGNDVEELEKVPFYPLNTHLPLCLQLKLRAKEINFLIDRLQNSLVDKMKSEGALSVAERIRESNRQEREAKIWFERSLKEQDMVRLENGRIVKREKMGEMGG